MSRKKAVETLVQAQTITNSYNDNFNMSDQLVFLDLFVQDDVQEELILRRNRRGKTSQDGRDDDDNDS
jgi:hypothetical protein